jgi:NADH-quinone oxidoreductase subunit E
MILSAPLTPAQQHPSEIQYSLSESVLAKFALEVQKFPHDQRQSAVMACLTIVQFEHGFVSQTHELEVAHYLEMPAIAVHEVATFYNMYNLSPLGRYKLNVCTNLSCLLKGGEDALAHACKKLKVQPGGTTADGLFTVQPAECLGACADAPVVLVNDRSMCSFMTPAKLDELIDGLTSLKESI